jgi:hypothetical protein
VRVLAYVHGSVPYLQAGSETMLHDLLIGLQGAGHAVAVVSMRTPGHVADWVIDGIASHCRPGQDAADAFAEQWGPDVIVSHHENAEHSIALAKRLGAASVPLIHNDFYISRNVIASHPDMVVCNTNWIARRLRPEAHGVRSIVVHPTIDAAKHATTPGDMVTMINMYRMKGSDTFWRLAMRCPQYKFLAVKGAYGVQDIRHGYKNVEVIETTTDMPGEVWSRTRMLLVPSRYESYGRVGVEACASGIPVMATPTPGLRESLRQAGIFIPRGNPNEWLRRLRHHMDNPAVWQRASDTARARIDTLDHAGEIAAWVRAVESLPLPR